MGILAEPMLLFPGRKRCRKECKFMSSKMKHTQAEWGWPTQPPPESQSLQHRRYADA
jgi:hypothetical protein